MSKIDRYWPKKWQKNPRDKYIPCLVQRKCMDLAVRQLTILRQLQSEGIAQNQLCHPIDKCRLLDYVGTIQCTWSLYSTRMLWESLILSAMCRVGLENNGKNPKASETVDCLLKIGFFHSLRGMNDPTKGNKSRLIKFFILIFFGISFFFYIVLSFNIWIENMIRLTLSAESTRAIGDKIASINKHPLNIIG